MVDRCVICGAVIPEGRQVCPDCESGRYCNTKGGCMICDRLFCGGVADGMGVVDPVNRDRRIPDRDLPGIVRGSGTDTAGGGAAPDPGAGS